MRLLPTTALIAALTLASCQERAQEPAPKPAIPPGANPLRWREAIADFESQDREAPPPRGGVVFVGSSSIRLWQTLADDMAPTPVVHRGFGGSKLFDAIYFSDELVSKHAPSVVVVFSGTNDIAGKSPKSAVEVRDLFRRLVARLRGPDPDLTICHIAITPTLAREQHISIVKEANRLIRSDCDADPQLEFVDPTIDLLDASGRPDQQWFASDRLHLNKRGYAIWTRHIRPLVGKLYQAANGR